MALPGRARRARPDGARNRFPPHAGRFAGVAPLPAGDAGVVAPRCEDARGPRARAPGRDPVARSRRIARPPRRCHLRDAIPPMRSTVIDLPQAIEHGRTLAHEAGHADLVDHVAGNLLVDPLPSADVILLSPTSCTTSRPRRRTGSSPGRTGVCTPDGTDRHLGGRGASRGAAGGTWRRRRALLQTDVEFRDASRRRLRAMACGQRVPARPAESPAARTRPRPHRRAPQPLPKSNRNPQTSRLRQLTCQHVNARPRTRRSA